MLELYNPKLDKSQYCILYFHFAVHILQWDITYEGKIKSSFISKNESGAHPQLITGDGADSMAIYNLCLFIKTAL